MECELLVQKFFPLLLIKREALINSAVILILTVFSFEYYDAYNWLCNWGILSPCKVFMKCSLDSGFTFLRENDELHCSLINAGQWGDTLLIDSRQLKACGKLCPCDNGLPQLHATEVFKRGMTAEPSSCFKNSEPLILIRNMWFVPWQWSNTMPSGYND